MSNDTLSAALEREHHEIDAGIERFSVEPSSAEAVEALRAAMTALRRHIYLEEEFLFPALREAGDAALVAPIFVMLREHGRMWQSLDALDRALADGCDESTIWTTAHQLRAALTHHNIKEERIIYPETDRTLPPDAAARLAAFIGSGQMPSGWVAAKAKG
ncbi:MAG: hemerythrin domain-containing protein [Jatrophihabitantaceae bacterium]